MFLGVWRRSSITQEILREWCSCEQVTLVENIGTPAFRRGDTCFEMFCVGLSTSQVEEALEAAKTMSGFDAGDAQRVLRIAGPLFLHDDTTVTTCDTVTCLRSRAVQICPDLSRSAEGCCARSADCIEDEAVGAGEHCDSCDSCDRMTRDGIPRFVKIRVG